jgi:hypothetical protein
LSVSNIQADVADTLPNGFQAVAGDPRLFDLREKRTNNAGFRGLSVRSQRANRLSESFRHHQFSPKQAEKPFATKINTHIHIYACHSNKILTGKPKLTNSGKVGLETGINLTSSVLQKAQWNIEKCLTLCQPTDGRLFLPREVTCETYICLSNDERGSFMSRRSLRLSEALDRKVNELVRRQGYRSWSAFVVEAIREKSLRADVLESMTEAETRIAASFEQIMEEIRSLQASMQAQFALTDALSKHLLTCIGEPPGELLESARVQAKARYDKLLRSAAKTIRDQMANALREVAVDRH